MIRINYYNRQDSFMGKILDSFIGQKVGKTRVVRISLKIVVVFLLFILVSNLSSNYINLILNRKELITQTRKMLSKDLKDIYNYCNNQYEIYQFSENLEESVSAIEKMGAMELPGKRSVLLGIKNDGALLFQASGGGRLENFTDSETLKGLVAKNESGTSEGPVTFDINSEEYFGFYKYSDKWGVFIVLAEEYNDFYSNSRRIFRDVSIIIFIISILSAIIGIFALRRILRYITIISSQIMEMVKSQQLGIVKLDGAPNDEITYLGMAFNSLSNTINTLLTIFRKFVNKDIAIKAYKEMQIRLEGSEKELSILFTDIKSFTYITETLGSDIIKLLNLHYNNAINEIMKHDGIIGSIIGDALLAVFGAIEEEGTENKSMAAILTAYRLQQVAASLRKEMTEKKADIEATRGRLTAAENRIYKAVLLKIGVGIDGGNVFYGNIGSHERMTNTVIGDNVNSASRLEGLTRVYNVPIICSEFIKDDIEKNVPDHGITFLELDMVQVKGKTKGRRIYWPMIPKYLKNDKLNDIEIYSDALEKYYAGEWKAAVSLFRKCSLPPAAEFISRIKDGVAPKNWKGIWEMKTK